MRALYGLAKGVIFGLLYLTWALAIKDPTILITLHPLNQSLIFLTMALCLIRGLPVIQAGRILFRAETNWPDPAALACVLALEAQGPQTSLADPVFHALTGK